MLTRRLFPTRKAFRNARFLNGFGSISSLFFEMPISIPRDAHLNSARCPSHSLRDAHLATARCPSHGIEMPILRDQVAILAQERYFILRKSDFFFINDFQDFNFEFSLKCVIVYFPVSEARSITSAFCIASFKLSDSVKRTFNFLIFDALTADSVSEPSVCAVTLKLPI